MIRRYASHYLLLPDGACLKQQLLEVEEGRVVRFSPFDGEELADTEWLPGVIVVRPEGVALHFPAFDLTTMQPVAGTLHRQLR